MCVDLGGPGGQVPVDASRNNWGVYSEALFPVLKNLEFTGSLRYDSYEKVNSKFVFATNPDANGNHGPEERCGRRAFVQRDRHAHPDAPMMASLLACAQHINLSLLLIRVNETCAFAADESRPFDPRSLSRVE